MMDTCEVIQVIRTTLLRRGNGTAENPTRVITQYWQLDGRLLWEEDPCADDDHVTEFTPTPRPF